MVELFTLFNYKYYYQPIHGAQAFIPSLWRAKSVYVILWPQNSHFPDAGNGLIQEVVNKELYVYEDCNCYISWYYVV